jgi:lipopolysaccharide transport system permease protein
MKAETQGGRELEQGLHDGSLPGSIDAPTAAGAPDSIAPGGRAGASQNRWASAGSVAFVMANLIARDFKIRYRNMSLGVLWSLANPLIMMLVLGFVFTRIFPNPTTKSYPAFILTGLIPYNFFALSWAAGTWSVYNNAQLIKRVPMPREIIPLAAVLANCLHLAIQLVLLMVFVAVLGYRPTLAWLWVPGVIAVEVMALCGLSLITSAFDVYLRDTRYFVESVNLVLFWLTPVFYPIEMVPAAYRQIYLLNPAAIAVISMRCMLLDGTMPPADIVVRGMIVSGILLAAGLAIFGRLKRQFADYL